MKKWKAITDENGYVKAIGNENGLPNGTEVQDDYTPSILMTAYKLVDGHLVLDEEKAEEIRKQFSKPAITTDERLDAIDSAIEAIAEMLGDK